MVVAGVPAYSLPTNIFELDANTVDATGGGEDWNTLYADTSAPFGSSAAFSGILEDPLNQTVFVQGETTKDDVDTDTWQHKTGSVPDKDELTNGYAAAYLGPDGPDTGTAQDIIIYFGADRYATNGAANLGFWFYQTEFGPDPIAAGADTGDFHGDPHTTGDVLVLSEFTNGGAVPNIQVWVWDPDNPAATTCPSNISGTTTVPCQDNDGTLKLIVNSGTADCDDAPGTAVACANVNGGGITVPWPYDAKGGGIQQGAVSAGGFFEGGVNLSTLFPSGAPCFSSFLAETRSSPSIDATLKDFVGGSLPLCSANIQIAGTNVNEVGESHTFTVTVNEVLAGTSSPSTDAHVSFTLVDSLGATSSLNAAASTCDDAGVNVDSSGQCTIVFSSPTTGLVTGNASATVPVGSTSFNVSTNGTAPNSGSALKRYVDARIQLSPLTDTNGITENHVVTADVDVDKGDGAGWVAATAGHVDVKLSNSSGASHSVNSAGTTCHVQDPPETPAGASNLDSNGRCTVAFTSNTAGTVTVNATVRLSLTVTQGTEEMTRTTGTGAPNSADATKDFVDGSLAWTKEDDQGQPLAGAVFRVCRTHNWDSNLTTPGMVDVTDVCVDVADDVSASETPDVVPDADNDGAEFLLEDLLLGRYTVVEKTAPTGYQLDPDTVTVDLTPSDKDKTILEPFKDPQLFKLIVITCNTATEALVDSTVDLDGAPGADERETIKASELPTGLTEATLCGLAGANYDNLPQGSYSPDVTLPDVGNQFP